MHALRSRDRFNQLLPTQFEGWRTTSAAGEQEFKEEEAPGGGSLTKASDDSQHPRCADACTKNHGENAGEVCEARIAQGYTVQYRSYLSRIIAFDVVLFRSLVSLVRLVRLAWFWVLAVGRSRSGSSVPHWCEPISISRRSATACKLVMCQILL